MSLIDEINADGVDKGGLVFSAVLIFVGTVAVVGWLLQWIWNAFVPDLFGLPEATWKQMVLMYLFFKTLQTKININIRKTS